MAEVEVNSRVTIEAPPRGGPLIRLMKQKLLPIMEVHSGLSAKIADEAGFDALWASGFSISSMMGLRDCNEASSSELLAVIDWILAASSIPLLVDGDSGHGNFNNARRFAKALARKGAAGVCFEDKLFPKRNSFDGEKHELLAPNQFAGMVAAARDSCDTDFAIVARTETLIAGRSIAEAIDRAHVYREAGADALVIHSKARTDDQVVEFARQWKQASPLIIVPTTYPDIDPDRLHRAGVSAVIWANHSLRASVNAMRDVCRSIVRLGRPVADRQLASMPEIFSLLDYEELDQAEQRYFPGGMA
jgi:phosphoenolpyruvate phosphomutase